MRREDIDECINACDAGREGELIFTYLYELSECKKPKKRLWLSSMTPTAIKQAFENLRSDEEMISLQDAARCRAESDWLVGINGTRAVTGRMLGKT
jgi:DNA topoisomerase-3